MAAETVSSLIRSITTRLSSVGIEDSGIDTRLLVRHAFGWSAEQQLGRLTDPAPAEQLELLESLVSRRVGREPLQYITGSAEFYRRRFSVDPRVLIPRPETEQLVVQAIEFVRERGIETPRVADICTGSGAVAISLALEMPAAEVVATDISAGALYVARQNAGSLGAEVNGDPGRVLPHVVNASIPGVDAEAAIVAIKDLVAISNGSACTSASYEPSHVLTAMGLEEDRVAGALRISWNHETPIPDWDAVTSRLSAITQ